MIELKQYNPHPGQQAFHWAVQYMYRYMLMLCGIRGGKTFAGAREATKQAWNFKDQPQAVYGIVAPNYHMLDRTTWREFIIAAKPFIKHENNTKKIITLENGREVFGFSAEEPDKIRNVTLLGAWCDEAREFKSFSKVWNILLGRVLTTNGKIIVTSSPNSYDDLHDIFLANPKKGYGNIRFSTYENETVDKEAIDSLAEDYDQKFMEQELMGQIVVFDGQVYYTFSRKDSAGDLAYKVANYDDSLPICLCADFNVDPMAWVLAQVHENNKLKDIRVFDEIYLRNSNTLEACQEFRTRYPDHDSGLILYGDATGQSRTTNSNVTNWKIIESELGMYHLTKKVPNKNPAERDRINAVNGMIKNSKGKLRTQINPNCKHLIRDLEQVAYKEGAAQINKTKDLSLTHPSDAFGYFIEREFSLNRSRYEGLKI